MKRIKLKQGQLVLVDDQDLEYLTRWKWYLTKSGYAARGTSEEGLRTIYMHRLVAQTPKGMSTDHINGDKLDNRRANLRICEEAKNRFNSKKYSNNTSGFKGVRRHRNRWDARLALSGKRIHLGTYDTPEEAAAAYDRAAVKYYGEFARINGTA